MVLPSKYCLSTKSIVSVMYPSTFFEHLCASKRSLIRNLHVPLRNAQILQHRVSHRLPRLI